MSITLTRTWNRRPLNRPYEALADPTTAGAPDTIFISVRGESTDQNLVTTADYYSVTSKEHAAAKILDYYGKGGSTSAMANNLQNESYYFAGTPQERVVLLYSVDLLLIEGAPCKSTFGTQAPGGNPQLYPVATFKAKIDDLSGMFDRFQNQYKFFAGRTNPPLSFTRIYNRLRLAHEKLVDFIEFNGLDYRMSEDDVIQINFNNDYKIDNIIVTQNGLEKHLVRGNIYFFEDLDRLNSSRTNEILYNLSALYSLRNQEYTWTDFIDKYMSDVRIDYFGLSMTPTLAEKIAKDSEDANKLFTSLKRGYDIKAAMDDPENQARAVNESLSEAQVTMQEKLSKTAAKIKEIDKGMMKAQMIINKFGINHLIEAALECIALKTGIPMDALPMTLPGIAFSPWELPKPAMSITIPKIYPLKNTQSRYWPSDNRGN